MLDGVYLQELIADVIAPFVFRLMVAGLILVVGWYLTKYAVRLAQRYMTRYNVDPLLVRFGSSILYWTLLLLVVIAALTQLGVSTTSLVALLGAAGLAVGLALQDSLQNFASGVLLIVFRPFKTGDVVETAGVTGTVEEITIFTTLLRTFDNQAVIIPNQKIYSDIITNRSSLPIRRVDLVFGIGYGDDIRKARRIIQQTLDSDGRILKEPAALVAVGELADSSVNFFVRPWVNNQDFQDVKFDLTERIKLAFDEEGVSIPFPQVDVHVDPRAHIPA